MRIPAGQLVARIAWAVPVVLLLLTFQQLKVTLDLGETMKQGTPAVARVTRYDRTDRKDVTHAELDLEIHLKDGTVLHKNNLALPYSIAHRVEGKDSLDVLVLRGASQEVVLTDIVGTQRRIAFYNIAMSLMAFLLVTVGVFFWNRMLRPSDESYI